MPKMTYDECQRFYWLHELGHRLAEFNRTHEFQHSVGMPSLPPAIIHQSLGWIGMSQPPQSRAKKPADPIK